MTMNISSFFKSLHRVQSAVCILHNLFIGHLVNQQILIEYDSLPATVLGTDDTPVDTTETSSSNYLHLTGR